MKDVNHAIEIDSNLAPGYFVRGDIYLNLKKYNLAIDDATKAIQIDPTDPDSYIVRGIAYSKKGKYSKARADLNKVMEIYPHSSRLSEIKKTLLEIDLATR